MHYLYALAVHNPTVDPKIKSSFKHFLVGCDCVYKAAMLMVSGSFSAASTRRIVRSEWALRKLNGTQSQAVNGL